MKLGAISICSANKSKSTPTEVSKTNAFGDTYFPSGKNYFTAVNNNLRNVGSQIIDDILKNNKEINAGKPHEYWDCKKITKNFKKNEKSACILFFVII
jgi:hypothetical protein